MHPYKQPVNIHYSSASTVSFYCCLPPRYLALIAVLIRLRVEYYVHTYINTELDKQ